MQRGTNEILSPAIKQRQLNDRSTPLNRTVVSPQPNNRANTTTCAKSGAKFRLGAMLRIVVAGLALALALEHPRDRRPGRSSSSQATRKTFRLWNMGVQIVSPAEFAMLLIEE